MDLMYTFANESSIHGFSHLVRKRAHWLEKVFWVAMLGISVVCSVSICKMHWERFQENATVLNVETDYLSWVFRPPAATVCSDHINEEKVAELVKRYWKVESNHSAFEHYQGYLQIVNRARFDNLDTFEPYVNDSSLVTVSILRLVSELSHPLTSPWKTFAPVLTEVGICYSSTVLYRFQSPIAHRFMRNYSKEMAPDCYTLDVCRTMVAMSHAESKRNDVVFVSLRDYIHNEEDVMTGDTAIHYVLGEHDIISSSLSVEQVVASRALKHLSARRRKCRLPNESLSYFSVYTINLCRISCRIDAALRICGCVPFFYNIGNLVCEPAGLYCLSRNFNHWYSAKNCSCPQLCESISLRQVTVKRKVLEQANSKLETQIIYSRMRMKRDVLFDISNLIVSLGGSTALFLGCSFISFVEIFYFILEYLASKKFTNFSSQVKRINKKMDTLIHPTKTV